MSWTPERVAVIREHAPTHSAAEIGAMLRTSRNAVLGYAHRNGISLSSDLKVRHPTPRNGGRPAGSSAKTKPSAGRSHSHQTRLTAVAAKLAGASYPEAARLAGCSRESIMLYWIKDPVLVAEARLIAKRAIAEARAAAERRDAKRQAERARIDAWNRGIAARAEARHGLMLDAFIETRSLQRAGEMVGVTRERIRQIVVQYEASHGFIRSGGNAKRRAA